MSRYLPRYQHFSPEHIRYKRTTTTENCSLTGVGTRPNSTSCYTEQLPAQTAGGKEKPGKAAGKASDEGLGQTPLALPMQNDWMLWHCFTPTHLTSEDLCSKCFLSDSSIWKMKINKKTFIEMTIERWCTNHGADQGAFWCMTEWSRRSLMSELRYVLSLPFTGEKRALIIIIFLHSSLCFNH